MTTVLFADRDGSAFGPLGARIVPALLPLGGIPVLEHALEALVRAGHRSALLVVGERAGEIERRFGKGIRWGIALEIVRREASETPGDVLRRLEPRLDGETIVVRGDVGTHAVIGEFLAKVDEARGPVVAGLLGGRPAGLWRLLPGALKKKDFPREPGSAEWVKEPDFAALALSEGPILLADVASYEKADRMAAGAAPAISERAKVEGSVALLAGTTVAEESVVLSGARLSAVSVLPRTAIPPGLSLEKVLVSGNLVVDAATGASSLLTDRLPPAQKKPPTSAGRGLGLVALALSLPLWPVAAVWSAIANAGHATRPVTLAGNGPDGSRASFSTFRFETAVPVLRDLPLLFAMLSGRLALSGVTPLAPAEEAALKEPWENVRNEAPAGVLSLARLTAPASAPPEVARVMDAFWTRTRSPLIGRSLAALFSARAWTAPKGWNPDALKEERKGMSTRELVVTAPFGGGELARIPSPSAEDVEAVVRRSVLAFEKTRAIPTFTRVAILRRVAAELERRRDELARTIAAEAGKPMKAARAEAERAVATFSATAAALEAQKGEMLPLDVNAASLGRWGVVKRVPLGPVLAITPFNFPLNLTSHKVAPAIAVGAPVVQKPASKTPLSALELREIVLRAGWPEDAYAVLPISGEAAEGLVLDPRLPVVSFTGSGAVGWRLKSLVPKKRVALELGGNAAVVVHSDADLDDAARRTASGAFSYAGQSCISVQRALVHRPAFEAFREKLLAATSALVVGDPLDEKTDVGPMIAPSEATRVEAWVAEAVAGGATALSGGTRVGDCLQPVILANTTPSMKVEGQEVFAPVVTLNAYEDFEEALRRVNDSKYGLQAGVFTRDLARIQRAFDVLEVGAVLANDVPTWRADRMPYGGVKESGSGREGPAYAMEEFTEPRLLVIRS